MRIEINEKPWDLVIIMALATLLLGVTFIVPTESLRIILGLAFVLFLPGYVIVSILFPKNKDLDTIERIALSFGLSIAIVPLIGFLLNYSPWGIRFYSILISLLVLIILGTIIAWYRRIQLPIEDRYCLIISIELTKGGGLTIADQILTILLAIVVIIAVCLFYYIITVPDKGEKYTEFYILDDNRTTENYPINITINENEAVILGVICREHEKTKYVIEVKLINLTGERMNNTLQQHNFSLKHNQHYEMIFHFNISKNGSYKLQFLLYINNIKEPYRELYIWINVKS